MIQNFASFYGEKKPLESEYCGYPWEIMNQNFASFHEENKPLECEYCGYQWNEKWFNFPFISWR